MSSSSLSFFVFASMNKFALAPRPIARSIQALLIAGAAALAGCGGGTAEGPEAPAKAATYYRDIKPIMESSCASCHTDGGIGPFPLTSVDDVTSRKDLIKYAVTERTMPPWPAGGGCNDYDFDISLSDQEIATIAAWADAGGPAGDPSQAVAGTPKDIGDLSRVDLTLPMPEAYTPEGAPDDYRCFVLDWPEQETKYVTGIGLQAGVPEILHHMIAFLATPTDVAEFEALDAADAKPGYTCYGGPGGSGRLPWIGTWVPGRPGLDFPDGTGIEVPAGSKIVMQLHYNMSFTAAAPDISKLLFRIEASVEKKASILPWTSLQWVLSKTMNIPAHSADVTHSMSGDPTAFASVATNGSLEDGKPLTIYTAGLHMHTRGKKATTLINRADGGETCLLDIPRWNFHWQGTYRLTEPTVLAPGDKLELSCTWDNPTDNDMNWGEGTADEMCLSSFYVTQ